MKARRESVPGVFIWACAAFGCCVVFGLPVLDTAMGHMLGRVMGDRSYTLLICVVGFGALAVQWLLLRAKGLWLRWVLPVASSAVLILAEGIWQLGGWDQIASMLLWFAGFPVLLGAALAVYGRYIRQQSRGVQVLTAVCLSFAVVLAAACRPRLLNGKIELAPPSEALLFEDGEVEWGMLRDPQAVLDSIFYMQVTPCVFAPEWDSQRGVLLRLNEDYVMVAHNGENPYVYRFAGPLEEFDGQGLKWKVWQWPAMYTNLRTEISSEK